MTRSSWRRWAPTTATCRINAQDTQDDKEDVNYLSRAALEVRVTKYIIYSYIMENTYWTISYFPEASAADPFLATMGHTFLEKRRSPPTNTISTTYICSCNHIHTYMHTYTYTCAEVGGEGGAAEHRRLGASRTAYSLNLQGLGGNRGSYWRMKVNEGAYNIFTYVYIYIYILADAMKLLISLRMQSSILFIIIKIYQYL